MYIYNGFKFQFQPTGLYLLAYRISSLNNEFIEQWKFLSSLYTYSRYLQHRLNHLF